MNLASRIRNRLSARAANNTPAHTTVNLSRTAIVLTILLSGTIAHAQLRTGWMKTARWGVMTHYLADWRARADKVPSSVETWNTMIEQFDVKAYADQLASVGAGYAIFTIGQNSGYYVSPNAAYDDIVGINPSKCSRRDLVADLSDALKKKGIRLIVYLPSGAPAGDSVARNNLEWQNGQHRNQAFQVKWEKIIAEWSMRWGSSVAGWWFDGCYWPNTMYRTTDPPNFSTFAAAARAGNREGVVAFNPGVVYRLISVTPYEDYTAGEIDQPDRISIRRTSDGIVDGAQLQVLSYLGERWGMGAPRFSVEQVVGWSKMVADTGGVMTWDVPVERNGRIAQPFLEQLKAIGRALKVRE